MTLANSLIYMMEFVIDDLVIVKQNLCAPEEYPTCVEISFRSNVFLNICDRDFGSCVNPKQPKCGKCCIFALDTPVTDKDRLWLHVYKKKTSRCKFLIGMTSMPLQPIFARVKASFDVENQGWEKIWQDKAASLPTLKGPNKDALDNCACYDPGLERREQLCPTSELTKRLLPLFNLCKQQTGNIVIKMRLLCNGPAIVSCFALNTTFCSRNPKCPPDPCCKPCPSPCGPCGPCPPPCPLPCEPPPPCDPCGEPCCPSSGPLDFCKKCCRSKCGPCFPGCVQEDPCYVPPKKIPKCLRYFACNLDKMCPCEYCEDEFDRECPTVPSKRCNKSVIERKLETCGPCGGVPAYPRWQQKKKEEEKANAKFEKKEKEKNIKKGAKKDARKKGGYEEADQEGRQQGGGISSDVTYIGPQTSRVDIYGNSGRCSAPQPSSCSCANMYGKSQQSESCFTPHQSQAGGFGEDNCCPAYENCCDLARSRAIRKLRHLLVKYNINVE